MSDVIQETTALFLPLVSHQSLNPTTVKMRRLRLGSASRLCRHGTRPDVRCQAVP